MKQVVSLIALYRILGLYLTIMNEICRCCALSAIGRYCVSWTLMASRLSQQPDHLPRCTNVTAALSAGTGGSLSRCSIRGLVPCLGTARGNFRAVTNLCPRPSEQLQAGSRCAMRQEQSTAGMKAGLAECSIRDLCPGLGISWPTANLKPWLHRRSPYTIPSIYHRYLFGPK